MRYMLSVDDTYAYLFQLNLEVPTYEFTEGDSKLVVG